MRGNQEAYILVKVKDGKKYVCAINKLKSTNKDGRNGRDNSKIDLDRDVLWQ